MTERPALLGRAGYPPGSQHVGEFRQSSFGQNRRFRTDSGEEVSEFHEILILKFEYRSISKSGFWQLFALLREKTFHAW